MRSALSLVVLCTRQACCWFGVARAFGSAAHLKAEGQQPGAPHCWATAVAAALALKPPAEKVLLGLQAGRGAAAGLLRQGQGQYWPEWGRLGGLGLGWESLRKGASVAPEPQTSFPHLQSQTRTLHRGLQRCKNQVKGCVKPQTLPALAF